MQRVRRQLRDERGFSLVELLVVVVILGILAGIAIPVFLSQRQKARDGAVKSDLRNAATAQVAYQIQHEVYADNEVDLADEVKFGPSDGVIFDQVARDADQRFCMVAHHEANGARYYVFDSDAPRPEGPHPDTSGLCPGL